MSAHDLPWWAPLSVVVWVVQMIAYHGFGLWFEYLDRTGALAAYKVRPVDAWTYRQVLPRVLVNQVFILLPAMALVQWAGLAYVGPEHIGWIAFVAGLVLMAIGHDVVQYVSHCWILHRPALMRTLGHSVHHSTTASRSISACFMSPTDFLLEIAFPYLLPLIAITLIGCAGADIRFHFLAVAAGAFGGLYEHSGYDFSVKLAGSDNALARFVAGRISSKAHAEHHSRGNVSFSDGFGSSNICDTVFKTRWDLVGPRERRRARPSGGRTA
ncbi:MAG: sterol desaturase family protein [Hyphomicrobiales bacterium]|nr:sterol desaturase family protein [Hyphomicrobiales bacterium]